MKKDFDGWNVQKKECNSNVRSLFYHKREVWWCALGTNVGNEIDGTGAQFDRPVLVLRGFNQETCLVICLTGRRKQGEYYFSVGIVEDREATAVLSQIRLIDTKRFLRKIGMVDETIFDELIRSLQAVLFDTVN